MSSAELINKTELTSIAGTEWVYIQEAASPYTVKKTLFNTIKTWITVLFDPGHPTTYYTSADYVILDSDGYINIFVNASSADRAITLPTKADNIKRLIRIMFVKDTAGTHKVTISPDAADSSTLSSDGLASIILPKVGDYVEFVESQDTGMWEIVNERITSQLRLNACAGFGSTDTKIMKFTNITENVGNMFSHNHGSYGVHGLDVTINRSGIYGATFKSASSSGAGEVFGISLNASSLTTGIISLADTQVLADKHLSANMYGSCGFILFLPKNSVLRTQVQTPVTPIGQVDFMLTYLGQ